MPILYLCLLIPIPQHHYVLYYLAFLHAIDGPRAKLIPLLKQYGLSTQLDALEFLYTGYW